LEKEPKVWSLNQREHPTHKKQKNLDEASTWGGHGGGIFQNEWEKNIVGKNKPANPVSGKKKRVQRSILGVSKGKKETKKRKKRMCVKKKKYQIAWVRRNHRPKKKNEKKSRRKLIETKAKEKFWKGKFPTEKKRGQNLGRGRSQEQGAQTVKWDVETNY